MKNNNFKKTEFCPLCGEHLVEIDDMNYITSICPHCFSTIFEELNGVLHVVKNGIDEDGYNVSMDVFYSQLLIHYMALSGKLGNVNTGEIIALRMFKLNIYNNLIFNHFSQMVKTFVLKERPYMYFKGYEKYFELSDKFTKETFPHLFN